MLIILFIYLFCRARNSYSFNWILKVDDDTYVNLSRLQDLLKAIHPKGPPMLLGTFLRNADTNLFGKWAEVEYSGSYPSFPTGAGYLLSG